MGRVVGAAGDDDLARGGGGAGRAVGADVVGAVRAEGGGAVEVGAVEELDTRGDGFFAGSGVEGDLGDVAVETHVERVLLAAVGVAGVADGNDKVAGSGAGAVLGAEGNLVVSGLSIAGEGVGVEVAAQNGGEVDGGLGDVAQGEGAAERERKKLRVLEGDGQGGDFGGQPPVPAVPAVETLDVVLFFHADEVATHVVG